MLTIRRDQLAVFTDLERRNFETRMIQHLHKCFPKQLEGTEDAELRGLIQYGVERSRSHRIKAERDVCRYIDLMVVFGRDFDVAPQHAWAAAILNDAGLRNSTKKMDRLFAAAKEHARQ